MQHQLKQEYSFYQWGRINKTIVNCLVLVTCYPIDFYKKTRIGFRGTWYIKSPYRGRIKDFFLKKMDENHRVYKDYKEFYDRLLILRREKSGGMEDILLAMATGYDYRKYQKSKPAK